MVAFLVSHYLLNIVDRGMTAVDFLLAFISVFIHDGVILPLVGLVGRPWDLETVPTEDYLIDVVLTPAVVTFYRGIPFRPCTGWLVKSR